MSDIAFNWGPQGADLELAGTDFVLDHELMTPVIVGLFSDRRALDSDPLPDESTDRRGWWGDSYATGRQIGSRLWLLSREKQMREVPNRAREYTREGLEELLSQGRAVDADVAATVPKARVLNLVVAVQRPQLDPVELTLEQAI